MSEKGSHIFKGSWMIKFRGRDIIGTLIEVGTVEAGQKAYNVPWTMEARDGPITMRLTAPRRRFRRPPLGHLLDEQRAVEQQGGAPTAEWEDDQGAGDEE